MDANFVPLVASVVPGEYALGHANGPLLEVGDLLVITIGGKMLDGMVVLGSYLCKEVNHTVDGLCLQLHTGDLCGLVLGMYVQRI